MTPARWAYLSIGVLVVGAALSFCSRRDGIAIGAQDQRIRTAAADVATIKLEKVVVDKAADVEVGKADRIRPERRAARAKVEIRGDTVVADGRTIELPSVANLVRVDDRQVAQDSTAFQAKAHSDSVNKILLGAYGKQVDLLEEAKRPRCSRKCGVAIGVGATVGVVTVAAIILHAVTK